MRWTPESHIKSDRICFSPVTQNDYVPTRARSTALGVMSSASFPLGGALRPEDCAERWDEYVDAHPKGSVFHLSAMFRVYQATPKYEAFPLAAENKEGRIIALLPAVRVSTVTGVASALASRSIWHAEPLCDPTQEGREALTNLIRLHDERMRGRTLFTEVRPLKPSGDERGALESQGYNFQDYLNYVVDVTPTAEDLWQNLSRSARQKIRRSTERGVAVVIDNTHEGIERMYRLVRASYKRSKVPLADIRLFHAALDELTPKVVQTRIATYEGNDVAGGIGLVHRGLFFAWYGGSLRVQQISPFDCLTWDELKWSSNNDLRHYDFGGAGWPNEEYGPRDFKAKFGGTLVRHGRYRRVYSPWKLRLAETAFLAARRFFPASS